ncbi:DUF3301 domain-containing protein [Motiliproteus sp. SC1-56]|uniref:DUF3301 domain-containing protein n=1 Tax=Motiliproteus sp. SC1-56 TaxID=2799565 RepID=UPI001A8C7D0D|nr:DUF3301 domain-containing protein [Motiliproteus sp. SC1-56]
MTLAPTDLLWLLFAFVLLQYWWSAKGVKELAYQACRRYCRELDLQLLDDTLVLRGLWLKRDPGGRLRFWRSYLFEFSSTGDERYRGRVILLGRRIEGIQLEPHRMGP